MKTAIALLIASGLAGAAVHTYDASQHQAQATHCQQAARNALVAATDGSESSDIAYYDGSKALGTDCGAQFVYSKGEVYAK